MIDVEEMKPGKTIEVTDSEFGRLIQQPTTVGTADMILQPGVMDAIAKASDMMAKARSMMPAHLRNSPGDCMAVLMQAAQWRMNPFALAQKTFMAGSVLGYEAQAIKAAIDSSSQLDGRLDFEWGGDWDKLLGKLTYKQSQKEGKGKYPVPTWTDADEANCWVICRGTIRGKVEPRELKLFMSQAHPRNSTLWVTDPKQQIAYLAAKRWSRLYLPEVLLGIYDEDEAQQIAEKNITPEAEPIQQPQKKSATTQPEKTKAEEARDKAAYEQLSKATYERFCELVGSASSHEELEAIRQKEAKELTGEYVEKGRNRWVSRYGELEPDTGPKTEPKESGQAQSGDFFEV